MRKVTQHVVTAFVEGRKASQANTRTDGHHLYLHGSMIARVDPTKASSTGTIPAVEVTTAGWDTRTTIDRLNAIPGCRVHVKSGQLYLNGKEWNGQWATL